MTWPKISTNMSIKLILNLLKFQHHSSNILEVIPKKQEGGAKTILLYYTLYLYNKRFTKTAVENFSAFFCKSYRGQIHTLPALFQKNRTNFSQISGKKLKYYKSSIYINMFCQLEINRSIIFKTKFIRLK